MLQHSEVLKFIQMTGIKTLSELKAQFAGEDQEILEMNLLFLVSKNRIRKTEYQTPTKPETIYYIPKQ